MLKPYLVLFTILSLILASCIANQVSSMAIEDRLMYAMIHRAADQLKKKHQLILTGQGGTSDIENKTTEIFASFQINHLLNQEEAQSIILDVAHVFLSVINNDQVYQPYLKYHPFSINELRIAIFISNQDGSSPKDPNFCTISLYNGLIHYYTEDLENPLKYKSEINESYERVIKKIKNEHQST